MSRFSNVKDQLAQLLVKGKEVSIEAYNELKDAVQDLKDSVLNRDKFAIKPVMLEFRCRGKLIFSVHSGNVTFPFKIGKAPDNDLVLPPQDRSSADHEIFLETDKGKIILKAEQDRLFYVHGVPKSSYVLPQEDRIAFGDCELFVSPAKKLKNTPSDVHRLEILNGPDQGKIVRIEKDHFIFGSDEACDMRLQAEVVSGKHAEVKIAPTGEAWLKDHQSLNGTFVNDKRLGTQDRVLMDSDKISVACFDFRFLDKNVLHTRSHLLRNLLVMGGTLAVILFIFLLFYINIPHASQVAVAVEHLMKVEKFDLAENYLNKMPRARDFKEHEATYFNLRNRLSVYRTTYDAWIGFQKSIQSGYFSSASEDIGRLDLSRESAWNWNASNVRARMHFARKCVQAWLLHREMQIFLYNNGALKDPTSLKTSYAEYLVTANQQKVKMPPNWIKPLYESIDDHLKALEKKCMQLDRINTALDSLIGNKATFEQVQTVLDKEQKDAGCLRYYMLKLQVVFDRMKVAQKTIENNIDHLTNYEFKKVDFSPDFPDAENCILYPALQKKREKLLSLHYKVLDAETTIRWACLNNFRELISQERMKIYQDLTLVALTEKYLFSCFNRPYYEILRDKNSVYNNHIGMRYWYNLIQQTLTLDKTGYDLSNIANDPKVLPIFKTGRILKEPYALVSHPEGKIFLKNQFGRDMKNVAVIMQKIKTMGKQANDTAEKEPGSRTYLIAKMMAFIMSSSYISQKEIERYRNYWKQYRQELQDLLDQYDPLDYKGSAKIRQKIFAIAIPGDPLISGVWNDVE